MTKLLTYPLSTGSFACLPRRGGTGTFALVVAVLAVAAARVNLVGIE